MGFVRDAGEVYSRSSHAAQHHTVIPKRPFDYVIVIGGVECTPEDEFLTSPDVGVILPRQPAITNFFADVPSERRSSNCGGGGRPAEPGPQKRGDRHIVLAVGGGGVRHQDRR